MYILIICVVLWGILSGTAYLTYKIGDSPSWEESLRRFVSCIVKLIHEAFTAPCEDGEDIGKTLVDDEPRQMTETLEQQPYEAPALANYWISKGMMVFDIRAAGLASKYTRLEENSPELTRLLQLKIYNYFMKVRGTPVRVCIRFATPTRLYFAVPFTDSAGKHLDAQGAKHRQIQQAQAQGTDAPGNGAAQSAILEEEIQVKKKTRRFHLMILGYHRNDFRNLGGLKIPFCVTLSKQTSSIILAGKSGSGKSMSGLWYDWQMLSSGESRVYIADYKGGFEYGAFEGSPSYAPGDEAVGMVRDFYGFFTAVRDSRCRLGHHYTLFIEEYFGLLSYAEAKDKKLKNELMSKIGEMLAVSRGLDMGIFLCVQRADSSNFSAGAREQFQCVLSFGRCSAEQFRMLGFSSELEENPTGGYKPGEALALADGQEGVQEILVPRITNVDEMCRGIRHYLDRQPDIPSLTRAAAGGGRTGQ